MTSRRPGASVAALAGAVALGAFGCALLLSTPAATLPDLPTPAVGAAPGGERAPAEPVAGGRAGEPVAAARAEPASEPPPVMQPERLPPRLLSRERAADLGLVIVPNVFDLRVPPDRNATFRSPLPGQAPASTLLGEFLAAGFVAGRAQSYRRVDGDGKLGAVIWSFESEQGAQRAFRALRDLAGRPGRDDPFAPLASRFEDAGLGLSELLWVRGNLLVRVSYAVPEGEIATARAVHERLARLVDRRAVAAASGVGAPPEAPAIQPEGLHARLLTLHVPDVDLPGGLNTVDQPLGGDGVLQREGAASGFERGVAAGILGGLTQRIGMAGRPGVRIDLTARLFTSPPAADAALQAVAAGGRPADEAPVPGAWEVGEPRASALWWTRDRLLLTVRVSWEEGLPQGPAARDRVAALLDARARRF